MISCTTGGYFCVYNDEYIYVHLYLHNKYARDVCSCTNMQTASWDLYRGCRSPWQPGSSHGTLVEGEGCRCGERRHSPIPPPLLSKPSVLPAAPGLTLPWAMVCQHGNKKQTNKQNIINNKINEAIPLFHFCCCSGTIHRRHRRSQQAGGCVW